MGNLIKLHTKLRTEATKLMSETPGNEEHRKKKHTVRENESGEFRVEELDSSWMVRKKGEGEHTKTYLKLRRSDTNLNNALQRCNNTINGIYH